MRRPWAGRQPDSPRTRQYIENRSLRSSGKLPADPGAVSDDAWLDHVYLRDNPRGPHWEWWHHSAGCRAWIKVKRDTMTHEILETAVASHPIAKDQA